MNTRILVCEYCEDLPQRQLGTIFIPPDPPPLLNARVEPYGMDEVPVSTRYTLNGSIRITIPIGVLFSMRIISGDFASATPS